MTNWFITGVSTGLGRSIAEAALAAGDIVVGTVRNANDASGFDALARDRAHGVILDVTDESAIPNVIAEAESLTGGIDILVNNAGYCLNGAIEEASMAEIRALFDVNFFGAVAVTQAVLPYMRTRKAGHILNISSISGLAPWAGTGTYGASKFALEGLGQTLATEVAELGIRVTNIQPGGLRTDFATRSLTITKKIISDYDGEARESRRVQSAHGGEEPGDPAKAAAAILQLVASEKPPTQLLLGSDAAFYLQREQDATAVDREKWMPVTLGIGIDED